MADAVRIVAGLSESGVFASPVIVVGGTSFEDTGFGESGDDWKSVSSGPGGPDYDAYSVDW